MNDGFFQFDAPYRIGQLNKRISLLKQADVKDESTRITRKQWCDALGFKIWARIEPLRGAAFLDAYKEGTKDIIKITIRYREGITTDMLVRYKDKLYAIDTIINPGEAHAKLELMCKIQAQGFNGVSESDT